MRGRVFRLRFLASVAFATLCVLAVACSDESQQSDPAQEQQSVAQQEQLAEQAQPSDDQAAPPPQPDPEPQSVEQEAQEQAEAEPAQSLQPEPEPLTYLGGELTPEPYDPEYALSVIEHLTNTIGPRVANSGSDLVAAEYLAETFRSLGYDAELVPFSYTPGAILTAISVGGETIATALLMQGAASGSVSAALVDVPGAGSVDDFASVDVSGAIAVVDRGILFFNEKAENARAAGAVALIVVNTDDSPFVGTIEPAVDLPVVGVSAWEGRLLRDRLGETAEIIAGEDSQSSVNVVARKPDGECRVVVGGHYDTVPSVVGANDNASGTAITVALAQAWQDADSARHICFVGFGAEELGLHGSRAFVANLRSRSALDQVGAMLNLDAIGDGNAPISIVGDPELQTQAVYLAEQLGQAAGRGALPMDIGSDHQPFADAGIPVVFPIYRGAILHVPADNFENLDRELTAQAGTLAHALLACLLYDLGATIVPSILCSEDHARLAPPVLDYGEASAAVVELAETLGPRPSGTPEEAAAAEHIAAILREYGYDTSLQPFEYSVEYRYAQIFLSETEDVAASHFLGSSPEAVTGPLLRIEGDGGPDGYQGLDAAGAVVLVDRGGLTFAEKAQQAADAGVAALIIINNDNSWLVGDLAGYRSPIPVLAVPSVMGINLSYRAPQVVSISPSQGESDRSQNVVAKRTGAACKVIVGAHYDTVYETAGYNDNSSGTALMLEFARIYAGHAAADQLCFVAFGGEEVGLYGSYEHVRQLQESGEIDQVRYMLNLDAIGAGSQYLIIFVDPSLRPLTRQLLEQLDLAIGDLSQAGVADSAPFQEAGVKTFFALPSGGAMNTIADDAGNFDAEVFNAVARLSEHVLQCMLERAGAQIQGNLDCSDP